MQFFNQTALSGKNNKRLHSSTPTNNERTAAWTDEAREIENSQVKIPATSCVEEAKDWVDNGSRL
ncbi:MAG: DUF3787 domain-containing protein [bacterium]|nr:DUF3787 domain-containing protein [bacterium]